MLRQASVGFCPSASALSFGLIGLGASHPRTVVCNWSVSSINKENGARFPYRHGDVLGALRPVDPMGLGLSALSYFCTTTCVVESRTRMSEGLGKMGRMGVLWERGVAVMVGCLNR